MAKGVLYRYHRMHQGGQSACEDPLASPEAFRAALLETYDLKFSSEQWAGSGVVSSSYASTGAMIWTSWR